MTNNITDLINATLRQRADLVEYLSDMAGGGIAHLLLMDPHEVVAIMRTISENCPPGLEMCLAAIATGILRDLHKRLAEGKAEMQGDWPKDLREDFLSMLDAAARIVEARGDELVSGAGASN